MKHILPFIVAIGVSATAIPGHAASYEKPWVLLGVDVYQGAVTSRDTSRDSGVSSSFGEGLPVFHTEEECQTALNWAIEKYEGLSHASGNYGHFACINWQTWKVSDK